MVRKSEVKVSDFTDANGNMAPCPPTIDTCHVWTPLLMHRKDSNFTMSSRPHQRVPAGQPWLVFIWLHSTGKRQCSTLPRTAAQPLSAPWAAS